MLQRIEDGFRSAAFRYPPFMEEADPVAQSRNRKKDMRDINYGGPHLAVRAGEQIQDFRMRDRVKGAGRLVREQQCRPVKDSHGDTHPLPLANAQL